MSETPCRGLLISVGGTPNPVAYSIARHRPEKVIFFASPESRGEIETRVRPLADHRWQDQEVITTRDPQDLTRSMEVLAEKLPECLANLGLFPQDLVVDYTGGTKTMSAALVLATIHQPVRYSYVGGTVRSKEGLGVVLDGSEAIVTSPNPWDVLAVELRRRMGRQFNRAQFAEARETAAEAVARVGERLRPFFASLRDLCEAYHRWSLFDYAALPGLIQGPFAKLRQLAGAANDEAMLAFLEQVEADIGRLAIIAPAFRALLGGQIPDLHGMRALVVDLVANSERTTRLGGRPDDGVARLYSALEKIAKMELLGLGVDNSGASADQIPEALRAEYQAKYGDPDRGVLRFGLLASYRLLQAHDHPAGLQFGERRVELESVLEVRNTSLMVHGWQPVKSATYDRLLALTLDFLGLDRAALPPLPEFPVP